MISGGYQSKPAPRKPKLEADTYKKHHFFASSAATWLTSYDVAELIVKLRLEGYAFNVWMVPGPLESPYKIQAYSPQVEGAQFLAFYSVPE